MRKIVARATLAVLLVGFFVVVGVYGAWWIPLVSIGAGLAIIGLVVVAR